MNPLATLTPPPRPAPAAAGDPVRRRAWLAGGALAVLLVVNLPPVLRTALDCDPIVFDLYVRDAGRGRVLYRDMLENNTPAMIWLQAGVRWALGWSSEALRAADLLVVGAGVGLLAGWFHRGRPDRTLFAACVLGSVYLSASEWCHCQRDVWLTLPVMAALYLRRSDVCSPHAPGAVRTARGACGPLLEGVVWGLAVWLKPHMLLVGLAVWLTGVALARGRGATWRAIALDLAGLVAGGLLVGAAGVGTMAATGVWGPYLAHLTTWAGEYPGADMYGPYGRGLMLVGRGVVNLPWSAVYLAVLPAGAVAAAGPFLGRRFAATPERALLGAALTAWAGQAFLLQHVFDYVHLPAALLAVALLLDVASDWPWSLIGIGAVAVVAHAPLFADRLQVWPECFAAPTPALRDRLARFDRLHWGRLQQVADHLAAEGCRDGELSLLSDTCLPLYQLTGLTAPTRYYIPRNNLLAYKSRRPEILAALSSVPNQRFAVVDLAALRWQPPDGQTWATRDDWPLDRCLGRWADRAAFRAGRYVVLRLESAEVPAFLADVSEF